MRYIVLGAGGVGSAIGGMLQASGAEVVLIARGAHLEAMARGGLSLTSPSRELHLVVEALPSPRGVRFEEGDVVLLAMKSQDTAAALADLAACAPRDVPVVCAQNGVANEPLAARLFSRVYGMVVFSPIQLVAPGRVAIHATPSLGGLDLGLHPTGTDALCHAVVGDLVAAGFDARAEPRISRWKYRKLLTNLGNVVQALVRGALAESPVLAAIQAEALACYGAAGIDHAALDEVHERYRDVGSADVAGAPRGGGSTWQSLARGTGTIETDFLNVEIVRIGERHGVATPMNRAVTALARRAAEERWPPSRLAPDELEAALRA